MMVKSLSAASMALGLSKASPTPMLTTILEIFGVCITFFNPSSLKRAGAISLLYSSCSLFISAHSPYFSDVFVAGLAAAFLAAGLVAAVLVSVFLVAGFAVVAFLAAGFSAVFLAADFTTGLSVVFLAADLATGLSVVF